MNVTGKEVWAKAKEDPEMLRQPESVQEAVRPYIEAAPVVLAGLLDKPATLNNVMQAKVDFTRYCLERGFIKAAVDAMPDEALGFFAREDLPAMFEGILTQLIVQVEELTGDVTALLKEYGVTEEEVMLGPQVGLNAEAQTLYRAGELTIGKILAIQPTIIVKNTND